MFEILNPFIFPVFPRIYSEVTEKLSSNSAQLNIALYKRERNRWVYFYTYVLLAIESLCIYMENSVH